MQVIQVSERGRNSRKRNICKGQGPKVSCRDMGHHYPYYLTSNKATGLPGNLDSCHSRTYFSQDWL